MSFHQKLLSLLLLFLTGVLAGAVLMIYSGTLDPREKVEVRISEISRTSDKADINANFHPAASENWFKAIANEVTPSVVYIETEMSAARSQMPDDEHHDLDDRFWQRFLPQQRVQAIGSGVIISTDGYILTNDHVIGRNTRNVRVGLFDKRYYDARIIGRDPSTDLAVLKIEAENLTPIVVGNSDLLEVGDWVMAVGNPFRLKSTVTAGIVSALNRDVDIIRDRMRIESFIQTDAAINRGNSGGALVNANGDLVGINTAIATESGGYQGYGFAIPINMAFKIGMDLIEFGEVKRPYLGVQIASVEQRRAEQLGLDRIRGVEVLGVARNGSADRAGIRRNDVILEVNGFAVNEANSLQERIALLRPEENVEVSVWRNGNVINKNITLMSLDDAEIRRWALNETEEPVETYWQDRMENEHLIREYNLGFSLIEAPAPDPQNEPEVTVLDVYPDSYADEAGLQPEDIILEINENPVASIDEFSEKYLERQRQERRIVLTIQRGEHQIIDLDFYP